MGEDFKAALDAFWGAIDTEVARLRQISEDHDGADWLEAMRTQLSFANLIIGPVR